MMKVWRRPATTAAIIGICTAMAFGDAEASNLRAKLIGFNEVPSISTQASGQFRATINQADTELAYDLEFSGLSAPVTQSHVHLGQVGVSGGVMFFLCGTATSPGPAGTPTCPPSGKVSGVVTAANVIGPAGQGISAGQFADVLRAIRAGFSYANVHSTKFPAGEIRGQIKTDD